MFNDFNPHIFDTIAGIRNEAEVARLLKLSGGNQPDFKMLLHEFGVKIMAAEKFLRRERELTGMFPGAMPLAYKLNPTLRKMKQDDLSKAKFGGIPNLAGLLSSVETQRRTDENSVAEIWPTCAVCRRHMRFACQLTLGGKGTLLHAMYAVENTGEPGTGNLISALGTGRTTCTTTHDAWLYVFLCPDSRFHYTNPNLDAQVLVESRPRNAEQKNLPAAKSAIEEFMRQIGELSEGVNRDQDIGSQGPEFPLAEIVSLKLHFDLDAELEFELQSAVDNWTRSKPDIFGRPESYAFFGKPQSNHVAMRPFCQRTLAGQPVRMPPFFSFFPTDEDAAYQLYADITCSEAHLYCKVDAY